MDGVSTDFKHTFSAAPFIRQPPFSLHFNFSFTLAVSGGTLEQLILSTSRMGTQGLSGNTVREGSVLSAFSQDSLWDLVAELRL